MAKAKLKLIELVCHKTEDYFEEDEPHITVNGHTIWRGTISKNQTMDLSRSGEIEFTESALITLFEEDSELWDQDDLLGTAYAFSNMIGYGPQRSTFSGHGADYELAFEVRPIAGTSSDALPAEEKEIVDHTHILAGVAIVANKNKLELHKVHCPYVEKILPENRFPAKGAMDGRNAAGYLKNGYDGCYYCLPEFHYK